MFATKSLLIFTGYLMDKRISQCIDANDFKYFDGKCPSKMREGSLTLQNSNHNLATPLIVRY